MTRQETIDYLRWLSEQTTPTTGLSHRVVLQRAAAMLSRESGERPLSFSGAAEAAGLAASARLRQIAEAEAALKDSVPATWRQDETDHGSRDWWHA
jgi:hypothetical protein